MSIIADAHILRRCAAVALACALSLGSLSASAEDEKSKTKSATVELMRSIFPADAYDAMLDQMYRQMAASMEQAGQKALTPEKQKSLKAVVKECLPYDELLGWTGDVYAKHFTRKEIEDLSTFYRTPTGKKVAKLIPVLGGEVGNKLVPVLMERMPAAMKKHGLQ